ncbi:MULTISPECIES: hypothetical protein [Moorena]|uniref:hypothetical protein n=1 Tax=Moorena TaxID=1155738 RepID=UPI001428FD3F|nr:hypothetical protein [Moorena sp. SIO4G3]NEO79880.1 hypothetical protein [Moorena sp. SIO4G3]
MLKPKSTLIAFLSTTGIASAVLLGSVSPAESCMYKKSINYIRAEQVNWLRSPWAAVITLPGLAMAAALYLGNRYYLSDRQ